jgi:hypothetical protein
VVDVLEDLFGLSVTSGAVGVLEGRQFARSDVLHRPHHPLESSAVAGGAVAVPGGDTAQQDALNCTSVKVLGPHFFSLLRLKRRCLCGWTIQFCQ